MDKPVETIKLKQLYFISFIEGGVVMVAELAGARMLTPFFGASLYSWASTLSITLLALMTGYYYGGYVTSKPKFSSSAMIPWVFFASGLTVFVMPSVGHFIMQQTISFPFFAGLLVSEMSFLFFPIFLMGMISPMIIFKITEKVEQSGRSAGNIYAISTSGGILFTLVFGFLIIPYYGISNPVRILGLIVAVIGLLFLISVRMVKKKIALSLFIGTLAVGLILQQARSKNSLENSDIKLQFASEGLMGELKVIDQVSYPPNTKPVTIRKLRINNIMQNYVFAELPTQSLMYYINFTKQLTGFLPAKGSALLLGLGAGSLYNILINQYRSVESVEIDQRIYDMGVRYFGMPAHKNHSITDGRYFVNVEKKKYDLIVVDAIIGENVPTQLLTQECFQKLSTLLNEDGAIIIEVGGLSNFSHNAFVPSVYKTLESSGFFVEIFNPLLSTEKGDVLFLATKSKFDTKHLPILSDVLVKAGNLFDYEVPIDAFDNGRSEILTDDKNKSDVMLKSHYFAVRKTIRKEIEKYKFWE